MSLIDMWMIDSLRERIVSHLTGLRETFDAVECIRFAMRFSVKTWIPGAIDKLVRREEPLSAEEMEAVGYRFAAKISTFREKNRSSLVHRTRQISHKELWDAWVPGCACAGCAYGKKVTCTPDATMMLKTPQLKYTFMMGNIAQEIRGVDIET
jgi:hypothetical protein